MLPDCVSAEVSLESFHSDHSEVMRTCTSCGETKVVAEFHRKGHDKKNIPRFQSSCKICANKQRITRYHKKVKKKTKKSTRVNKSFDVSSCKIEIIFPESTEGEFDMEQIISDYIEAVYATTIQESYFKKEC